MLCGGDGKHMGQCTRLYWTGCFRNINGIKCIHLPGFSLDCFWGWIEGHLEFEYMSCGTWIVLDPTIKPWFLNTWNVDHSKSGSRVETVFSDQLISGWFWFLLFFPNVDYYQSDLIWNLDFFEFVLFWNLKHVYCFDTWIIANPNLEMKLGSCWTRCWIFKICSLTPRFEKPYICLNWVSLTPAWILLYHWIRQ